MTLPETSPESARRLQDLEAEVARLHRLLHLKDEQIRFLNFRLFGPKSDKLSSVQTPLLLAEISLCVAEVETEAERPEAQKQNLLPKRRDKSGSQL